MARPMTDVTPKIARGTRRKANIPSSYRRNGEHASRRTSMRRSLEIVAYLSQAAARRRVGALRRHRFAKMLDVLTDLHFERFVAVCTIQLRREHVVRLERELRGVLRDVGEG